MQAAGNSSCIGLFGRVLSSATTRSLLIGEQSAPVIKIGQMRSLNTSKALTADTADKAAYIRQASNCHAWKGDLNIEKATTPCSTCWSFSRFPRLSLYPSLPVTPILPRPSTQLPHTAMTPTADNTNSNLSSDILLGFFLTPPKEEWISGLKSKYPGLEVRWALMMDGTRMIPPEERPPEIWDGVTILMLPEVAPAARFLKSVRFVQSASSGLDRWHGNAKFNDPEVLFANSRGATG